MNDKERFHALMPMADHQIPPDVSYENFRHYLALKRKLIENT